MTPVDHSKLSDYWHPLVRSRRLILLSTALGLALGILVNVSTRPSYRAVARIQINKAASRSPLTGEVIDGDSWQSDNVNLFTAAAMLSNKTMLEHAAERMIAHGDLRPTDIIDDRPGETWSTVARLIHLPPPQVGHAESLNALTRESRKRLADWLLSVLTIEPIRDTRLVSIQAEHWDPNCARRIVNTVVQTFMEFEATQRAAADTTRVAYLRQQLAIEKERIDQGDRGALASSNAGLTVLQARQEQLGVSSGSLSDSYMKVKTDRLAAEARLAAIRALTLEQLGSARGLTLEGGSLVQLRQDLQRCQTELARARQVYKEKHPKLTVLLSQEASIQDDIRRELQAVIASLDAERVVLVSRERSLRDAINQTEGERHEVQDRIASFSTRESELKRDRELYSLLLAKIQETEIASAVENPLAVLVEPATVGDRPVRPRKAMNLILGMVVGCLSGSGIALTRQAVRRRIQTPQDVMEHLQLVVLGMIEKRSTRSA